MFDKAEPIQTNVDTVVRFVRSKIVSTGGPVPAPLKDSADGLRVFTQTNVERADAIHAESDEMQRVTEDHGAAPIPGRNTKRDADIEFEMAPGQRTAIEVKAVNSETPGAVTARINEADQQLGRRNVQQREIAVLIAHGANQWPGKVRYGARDRAALEVDVAAQLALMPRLAHADVIRIENVNLPSGIQAKVEAKRDRNGRRWTAWTVKATLLSSRSDAADDDPAASDTSDSDMSDDDGAAASPASRGRVRKRAKHGPAAGAAAAAAAATAAPAPAFRGQARGQRSRRAP